MPLFDSFSHLRPDDTALSPRARTVVQGGRLLTLLGVVIYLGFGLLYAVSAPEATDPLWMRLAISGGLVALFVASYVWPFFRRTYPQWIHGMFYVITVWVATLATVNQFTSNFTAVFLVTFTIHAGLIGFYAQRATPVLWFSGLVVLMTGVGLVLGPSPKISVALLFSSIGSVAAIGSLAGFWAGTVRETIRRNELSLQTITDNVSDGIYRSTPDDGIVYVNQAFINMFGYGGLDELLTVPSRRLYADPSRRDELLERATDQGGLEPTEVEFRRKDDSTFTGLLCESVVRDADGTVLYTDGTLVNISERKERERELARRKALLEAQAEATIDGLLVVDRNRNVVYHNDRLLEIWDIPEGVAEQKPAGKTLDDMFIKHVADIIQNPAEFRERVEYLYDHPAEESRHLIQLTDGRWLDRYSTPILGEDDTYFGRLWIFRDVAEQKQREEQLEYKATHDDLTGLPNRAALHNELQGLIDTSRDASLSALLYLDLDHFKRVNDNLGHVMGDELLVTVASRLEKTVRDADLVARVGGDEFAVCLTEVSDEERVYKVAERIHQELSNSFELDGQEVYAPASIGVVTELSRAESVEDALRDADAAMYEAKKIHKAEEHVHQPFIVFEDSTPHETDAEIPVT